MPEDFCKDDEETRAMFVNGPYYDLVSKVDKIRTVDSEEEYDDSNDDHKSLPVFKILCDDDNPDAETVQALLNHIQGRDRHSSLCCCSE